MLSGVVVRRHFLSPPFRVFTPVHLYIFRHSSTSPVLFFFDIQTRVNASDFGKCGASFQTMWSLCCLLSLLKVTLFLPPVGVFIFFTLVTFSLHFCPPTHLTLQRVLHRRRSKHEELNLCAFEKPQALACLGVNIPPSAPWFLSDSWNR